MTTTELTDEQVRKVFKISGKEMGEPETLDLMDAYEEFDKLIDALPVNFLRGKLAKDEGLIDFLEIAEVGK